VNPQGATVTACTFEYGSTPAYGTTVPCPQEVGAGFEPVGVSVALSGLSPSSTYYYRIVATNEAGTSEEAQRTLTTLEERPPSVQTTPATPGGYGEFLTSIQTRGVPANSRLRRPHPE
jgi:phosphodiesterase/alkaline phosphatase D-like protein